MGLEYGLLTYDVPITERSLYNKLRQRIRKVCIPLNWSAYLIPWGLRDTVTTILQEVQSEKPNVISSGVHKFDSSEEANLANAAQRGLALIMKKAHDLVIKRLTEAETNFKETTEKVNSALKVKNRKNSDAELLKIRGFAEDQFEIDMKKALSAGEKALKEAQGLATVFALSSALEFAVEAESSFLEEKRQLFKASQLAYQVANEKKAEPAKVEAK